MNMPEKRTSILIVEDHGVASTGLQFLLGREDTIRVLGVVHRGDQAEDEIAIRNPDIVILDLALPGKSGLAILESMRTHKTPCKVIILSGQASGLEFKQAIDMGADGVISKADPPELIFAALDSIAQGACFISNTVRALVEPVGDGRGHGLTARERQVLILLAEGLSNAGIAEKIGTEVRTARKHRENLMRKLNVSNAVEASRIAQQLGLIIMTPKT